MVPVVPRQSASDPSAHCPRPSRPSVSAIPGTPPDVHGSLEADNGLVTDILFAIGREELADNPASIELMKDVLRQAEGDAIRAAELIKDIMADTGSSPAAPQQLGRHEEEPVLPERTGSNFQENLYQDVLRKAGGDETRALWMMRNLGMEPPQSSQSSSRMLTTAGSNPASSVNDQPAGGAFEIFMDIVRQNNGNTSLGVQKMAELGITMDDQAVVAAADALARERFGQPHGSVDHQQVASAGHPCFRQHHQAAGLELAMDTVTTISAPALSQGSLASAPSQGSGGPAHTWSNSETTRPPSLVFPGEGASLGAPSNFAPALDSSALFPARASLLEPHAQPAGQRQLLPPSRQSASRQSQHPLLRTYQALAAATDNFSQGNLLGAGGFGAVYRGALPDGTEIAVKKLDTSGLQGEREFQREIKILGKYQSPHVVKLLGYALDEAAYCLVYELMDGSLDTRLEQGPTLSWQNRIAIAMQAASGLAYLHRGTTFPLAHMDVKSANVLLREEGGAFSFAKIGDVGLAQLQFSVDGMSITNLSSGKLSMRRGAPMPSMTMTMGSAATTSTLRGSNGYLDPVYLETGRGGSSNDVFAFGVVLLELITGRPAIYRRDGTGPAVMLANEVGGKMVAIGNGCPVHEGFLVQLLQYTKTVVDPQAGTWPDWAVDALACCAVCCLLPDRSLRVKMDAMMVRLAELHVRAGGEVPGGVLQVCEAVGASVSN